MQVDAISNDDVQTGKTSKCVMSLLAAIAVAAAAGLSTIDIPEAKLTPHVQRTDVKENGVRPSTSAGIQATPTREGLAPELQRSDRPGKSHG